MYMYDQQRAGNPRIGEIILYTVQKGDNVYRLAKVFRSQVNWIQVMNNLNNDFLIYPNQELMIPVLYEQQAQPYQRQSYDLYF
jgi:LysM repeat protein